jgi:ABC-2 type transport system ATP-binding protein
MDSPSIVRTRDLTKRFDRHTVLHDVNLDLVSGEVYGLIGPNGAGKTTLIRLLATAEEPTLGEIQIHGEPLVYDRSHAHIKQHIGYLPDDFPLYEDLSVWDYLDYFARLYKLRGTQRTRRLFEVLELVNLVHKRNSLTHTLSRGMKQRLGLARTIIHQPSILLLDEPVSGLDPIARREFREAIKLLKSGGVTILISSHILSDLAELCTTIGVLEFGYLVESTSLEKLYARSSSQQILIKTLGSLQDLCHHLHQTLQVENLEIIPNSNQVSLQFTGTDDEAADLLRSLIDAKIRVSEFTCKHQNLEDIFFNLGHTQPT